MTSLLAPVRLRSRHRHPKPVSWLELFFDLAFVAAVAQVGTPFAHDYTFAGLARYAFLFFLIWLAWLGHTMFNTRFLSDDPLQRVLTLFQIFLIAVMAANSKQDLGSRDAAGFAAAYAMVRLVLVAQYLRARRLPEARRVATLHAIGFAIAASLWLASAITPVPVRFYLWGFALLVDVVTPSLAHRTLHKLPPDPEHLPERFGLFTIILLGESVMAVMRGIESQEGWTPQAALSAIFALSTVFAFWWWYFEISGASEERTVRDRKHAARLRLWQYLHFPLYLAISASGVGFEEIIASGGHYALPPHGQRLLVCTAAAVTICLLLLSRTSPRQAVRRSALPFLGPALMLAAAALALPSYLLLAYILLLCVANTLAARARTGSTPGHTATLEIGTVEVS